MSRPVWFPSDIATDSGGVIRPSSHGFPEEAERAAICLRRVLQLKPDHPTARQQLVELSPFLDHGADGPPSPGELSFALRLGEVTSPKRIEHGRLSPATRAAVLRSEKYRLTGDFEAALHAQEEAYRLSPKSIGVIHNLCILLGHAGRLDDALRLLEEALAISPSNCDLILNYAFYLGAAGRHDDAIRAAQKAIDVEPLSSSNWLPLAAAYADAGRRDQALDALRTCIRMSGPWSMVLSHAADLGAKLGVQDILEF